MSLAGVFPGVVVKMRPAWFVRAELLRPDCMKDLQEELMSSLRCSFSNLDPLSAQEVGGGVQHVCGVRGVVVGVGGMVAGFDELQPGAQRGLRAVQEVAHAETGENLQAEISQRPAGKRIRGETLTSKPKMELFQGLLSILCSSVYIDSPLVSRCFQLQDVEIPAFLVIQHLCDGRRHVV